MEPASLGEIPKSDHLKRNRASPIQPAGGQGFRCRFGRSASWPFWPPVRGSPVHPGGGFWPLDGQPSVDHDVRDLQPASRRHDGRNEIERGNQVGTENIKSRQVRPLARHEGLRVAVYQPVLRWRETARAIQALICIEGFRGSENFGFGRRGRKTCLKKTRRAETRGGTPVPPAGRVRFWAASSKRSRPSPKD